MTPIKENTVFVLGAGASIPFGYPTGDGLRESICALDPDDISNKMAQAYSEAGDKAFTVHKNEYKLQISDFQKKIGYSHVQVDRFIKEGYCVNLNYYHYILIHSVDQ